MPCRPSPGLRPPQQRNADIAAQPKRCPVCRNHSVVGLSRLRVVESAARGLAGAVRNEAAANLQAAEGAAAQRRMGIVDVGGGRRALADGDDPHADLRAAAPDADDRAGGFGPIAQDALGLRAQPDRRKQ